MAETSPLLDNQFDADSVANSMNYDATGAPSNRSRSPYVQALADTESSISPSDQASGSISDAGSNVQDWQQDNNLPDAETILQACVFIEDALEYRTINHKVDPTAIKLYRSYYSPIFQWTLKAVILILHLLAFIETPSSLTTSSDLRIRGESFELKCGVTEAIEFLCLTCLLIDASLQVYFKGLSGCRRDKWLMGSCIVLLASFVDWLVSVSMGCPDHIRMRRMLRPFFLVQHSQLMKKTIKALRRTLPQVFSVLLLLGFHLYFFTLFGMLLFPKDNRHIIFPLQPKFNNSNSQYDEYDTYFKNLTDAFVHMLVLTTTANNPDITLPAYNVNRVYIVFFIIFIVIGVYCLMNMITAVIYNQFRGYFLASMQSSLFRKRMGIRAAFEVLRRRKLRYAGMSDIGVVSNSVSRSALFWAISLSYIATPLKKKLSTKLRQSSRSTLTLNQYMRVFAVLEQDNTDVLQPEKNVFSSRWGKLMQTVVLHRAFIIIGFLIALGNVIVITVELVTEYDKVRSAPNNHLGIVNMVLIPYYITETILTGWAMGWAHYLYRWSHVFDVLVATALGLTQITYLVLFELPWNRDIPHNSLTVWDLARLINMLILIRLMRIVTGQFKIMNIVATTLYDLMYNLKAFAGILVVIYYFFGLLGMNLFGGVIIFDKNGTSERYRTCGTYEELGYWSNNFDDFAASLVTLWNLMIVNNWQVFLSVYSHHYSRWSVLFFITWWVVAVVVAMSLFTALILENFIMHWDHMTKLNPEQQRQTNEGWTGMSRATLSVHDMFRQDLQEPSEEALLGELRGHSHLTLREGEGSSTRRQRSPRTHFRL